MLHNKKHKSFSRPGISAIELVIAAMILVGVMTVVTSLCFRVQLVWKDVRQQRIAVNELSNQLERLTLLDLRDAESAIQSMEPSEWCKRALTDPELSGVIVRDDLGHRIEIQVRWKRKFERQPIRLAGWLIDESAGGKP